MFPKAAMKMVWRSRCPGFAITIAMRAASLQMQIFLTGPRTLLAKTTELGPVPVSTDQLVNKA